MNIVQIVVIFGILYMLFLVRGQLQAILECLQGSGAGAVGEALWDKLDVVSHKLDSVNTNLQGLRMIENELKDFRLDVASWIKVSGKDLGEK